MEFGVHGAFLIITMDTCVIKKGIHFTERLRTKYKSTMAKRVLTIEIMNLGRQLSHDKVFTIASGLQLRLKIS